MVSQKVEEWIKGKLDEGVPKDRLKRTLKDEGFDPSIVDELADNQEESDESKDYGFSFVSEDGKEAEADKNGFSITDSSSQPSGDRQKKQRNSGKSDDTFRKGDKKKAGRSEAGKEPGESSFLGVISGKIGAMRGQIGEKRQVAVKKAKKIFQSSRGVGPSFSDALSSSQRAVQKSVPLVLILVLLAGAYFFFPFGAAGDYVSDIAGSLQQDDRADISQQRGNDRVETGTSSTQIVLEGRTADPSRAEINSSGTVEFVNRRQDILQVEFDSEIAGFELQPDESRALNITSITYYTASPAEGNKIYGSVYVE